MTMLEGSHTVQGKSSGSAVLPTQVIFCRSFSLRFTSSLKGIRVSRQNWISGG